MKSVLELLLIGLCVITLTLLLCWGWWELQYWWQLHRRSASNAAREDDKN